MALPTPETPVAKSLHTLKVIEQVARYIANSKEPVIPPTEGAEAIAQAMQVLGLAGRPDPYGLAARALVNLTKGA